MKNRMLAIVATIAVCGGLASMAIGCASTPNLNLTQNFYDNAYASDQPSAPQDQPLYLPAVDDYQVFNTARTIDVGYQASPREEVNPQIAVQPVVVQPIAIQPNVTTSNTEPITVSCTCRARCRCGCQQRSRVYTNSNLLTKSRRLVPLHSEQQLTVPAYAYRTTTVVGRENTRQTTRVKAKYNRRPVYHVSMVRAKLRYGDVGSQTY